MSPWRRIIAARPTDGTGPPTHLWCNLHSDSVMSPSRCLYIYRPPFLLAPRQQKLGILVQQQGRCPQDYSPYLDCTLPVSTLAPMLATLLIHRLCNAEVSCSTAEFYSSKGVTSAIELSSAVNFVPSPVSLRSVAVLVVC